MKYFLSACFFLFLYLPASGQCVQKWLYYNANRKDTILSVLTPAVKDTIDIFGKKLPRRFIDSIIVFLDAKEQRKQDNNAMFSNYRIFHYQQLEIILKDVVSKRFDCNILSLYNFSVSDGFNGSDWSDNALYAFTYTKQYGLVYKHFWEKDMSLNTLNKAILLTDTCIKRCPSNLKEIFYLLR
jgi:hypothetical protein